MDRRSPEECWNWTGTKQGGKGYPKDSGYGKIVIKKRAWSAHRVSWVLNGGRIPDGLYVLHECDNKACVNPGHLSIGTAARNMRDAVLRGRINRRGERGGNHKLTDADVYEIRARAQRGEKAVSIAKDFHCYVRHIRYIISRRYWSHLGMTTPSTTDPANEDARHIIMFCGSLKQFVASIPDEPDSRWFADVETTIDAIERRAVLIVEKLEGKPL